MDTSKNTFSERLKTLIGEEQTRRKKSKRAFGIEAIAQDISQDINRHTMLAYLNKNANPSLGRLQSIAQYFDVSTDYLIGLSDSRNTYTGKRHEEAQAIADYLRLNAATVERLREVGEISYFKKNGVVSTEQNKYSKAIDTFVNSDGFTGIITRLADYLSGADYKTVIEAEADQSRRVFIANESGENAQSFAQVDLSETALTMLINDFRAIRRKARGNK